MVSKYRSIIHPKCDQLPDGTEVRLVPMERTKFRPLYVTSDGRPFSHVLVKDKTTGLYRWEFHLLATMTDTSKTNKYNGNRKQKYRKMSSDYGHMLVHTAVALAWIGPQPTYISPRTGKETLCVVDHLNGVTTDNRVENLQWVSRQENERRMPYIRSLRELIPTHAQLYAREDYLRWFATPLPEFQSMLSMYHPGQPLDFGAEPNKYADPFIERDDPA